MNLTINFNWPTGKGTASVGLGQPNVEDREMEFRIGAVPKEHTDKIWWHDSGWVAGDENMPRIEFYARQGDKVVVHKRKKGSDKAESRLEWDINEHWPADAHGPAMVVVPWYF